MVAIQPATKATAPAKPEPHPGAAAVAIAGMALAVAGALAFIGLTSRLDVAMGEAVRAFGLTGELRALPAWWAWGWTVLATVLVCQAMLHVVGHWRRTVVAVLAVLLTVTWVPVLALAAYLPPVGAALVALAWAIGGSMIYAVRHREPK